MVPFNFSIKSGAFMAMKQFSFLVLLLTFELCLGCGKSTTVTGPDGEKMTVTKKGDGMEMTVQGKLGKKAHISANKDGVALPEDFPTDVPIYPKATVVTAMTIEKAQMVSLKTADSVKQAEAYYKEKLKDNGWEIKTSMNTEDGMMLQGQKKGHVLTVMVSGKSDETMIQLTVAPEK
jgi:hypothetical protein